jgi:hypothetical protein
MVTREEAEGMRQELRSLLGEKRKLCKAQEEELDRFHHQWAVKVRQVKVEGTDKVKPYVADKKKNCEGIQAALLTKLEWLDGQKREHLRMIEEEYKVDKKLAQQDAERQLSDVRRRFDEYAKILAEELKDALASCEVERDAALEALRRTHTSALQVLSDKVAVLEKKMSAVGAK